MVCQSQPPVQEISIPAKNQSNQAEKPCLVSQNKPPFMPLPPPPFSLMNQNKKCPSPTLSTSNATKENLEQKHIHVYYVDGARGMNVVRILREKSKETVSEDENDATRAAAKPEATVKSSDSSAKAASLSPVKRKTSAKRKRTTSKSATLVRKKWLPSLGPPESEAFRRLSMKLNKKTWYCENAEIFSTLVATVRN